MYRDRKVVCLCGSTRFKEQFDEIDKELTLEGCIVLRPGVWGHCGDEITQAQKDALDNLHITKIQMSDEIYVIDVNGYIGRSTSLEIDAASLMGKPKRYYSREKGEK